MTSAAFATFVALACLWAAIVLFLAVLILVRVLRSLRRIRRQAEEISAQVDALFMRGRR